MQEEKIESVPQVILEAESISLSFLKVLPIMRPINLYGWFKEREDEEIEYLVGSRLSGFVFCGSKSGR